MSTTKQAISKELNKLNDYEQQAFYELLRYYTSFHKAKYPNWPRTFEEACKPFEIEGEKYQHEIIEREEDIPKSVMPVLVANLTAHAFVLEQEKKEAQ